MAESGGYVDLTIPEIVAVAQGLQLTCPTWLFPESAEFDLGSLTDDGKASLLERGLAAEQDGRVTDLDEWVAEVVELACTPRMITVVLHLDTQAELSWLLCGSERMAIVTRFADHLRFRSRATSEILAVVGLLTRLVETDELSSTSAPAWSIPVGALRGASDNDDQQATEILGRLPTEELKTIASTLGQFRTISTVETTYPNGEDDVRRSHTAWFVGGDGTLRLLDYEPGESLSRSSTTPAAVMARAAQQL